MHAPTNRQLLGYWRRKLFWSWVAASIGVGAFVGIAGPITSHVGDGQALVALSVPLLMLFMMLTGFAWLLCLMMYPPKWRNDKGNGVRPRPPQTFTPRKPILEHT